MAGPDRGGRWSVNGERESPREQGAKLTGIEGYRKRVGDYRILFEVGDDTSGVWVHRVKHRREAYRRR